MTAAKVGISPTYLSRIETMGEKTPPAEEVIRKLAKLLGEDFDGLMQLAGRIPEDVRQIVKSDQSLVAFLRAAKRRNYSAKDLMRLLDAKKAKS